MKATNIKWDTDGHVIEWLTLNVTIPPNIEEDRITKNFPRKPTCFNHGMNWKK